MEGDTRWWWRTLRVGGGGGGGGGGGHLELVEVVVEVVVEDT